MPSEPAGASGAPPFRRPDPHLRVRSVRLPSVRDETRRAWRMFAFLVGTTVAVLVPTGIFVTHGAELLNGTMPDAPVLLRTAVWFGGCALALMVPLAGGGLIREVRRYRRVRQQIGERATLESSGLLRSEDGQRSFSLRT